VRFRGRVVRSASIASMLTTYRGKPVQEITASPRGSLDELGIPISPARMKCATSPSTRSGSRSRRSHEEED